MEIASRIPRSRNRFHPAVCRGERGVRAPDALLPPCRSCPHRPPRSARDAAFRPVGTNLVGARGRGSWGSQQRLAVPNGSLGTANRSVGLDEQNDRGAKVEHAEFIPPSYGERRFDAV